MVFVVAADAAAETMVARATEMARSVRGTRALTHSRNGAISRNVAAWLRIRNPTGDCDAAAFASADADVAAVRVDDLARQGQSEACAAGFRRIEREERVAQRLVVHPLS